MFLVATRVQMGVVSRQDIYCHNVGYIKTTPNKNFKKNEKIVKKLNEISQAVRPDTLDAKINK